MDKGLSYLEAIKAKIREGDLDGAEFDLHRLVVNRDFDRLWGNRALPVIWGYIAHIKLSHPAITHGEIGTAAVDLPSGRVLINPKFLLEKIHSLEDLLFLVLHERDHRILRRLFRINWHRLNKILDYKEEWISSVRNVIEDAWINASVRSEMGINSGLSEQFYCWSEEDAKNPGMPTDENPDASGFDPNIHTVGEPKSDEYALLTCMSHFVDKGIQNEHGQLYAEAHSLLEKYGLPSFGANTRRRSRYYDDRSYHDMMGFPAWYDAFCDWLRIHKDDLALPTPGCQGDSDCPVHGDQPPDDSDSGEGDQDGEGNQSGSEGEGSGDDGEEGKGSEGTEEGGSGGSGDSSEGSQGSEGNGSSQGSEGSGGSGGSAGGKDSSDSGQRDLSDGDSDGQGKPTTGNHAHGGNKKCTCRGGQGLLGEPMTLAERLSRVPDIVVSRDELEKILDKLGGQEDSGADYRKGPKPDKSGEDKDDGKPLEVFGQGAGWGGHLRAVEIAPRAVQSLDEIDRELLEIGGSALTDAWKTSTVQIKGAIKQYADELVQNIATLRVTEHKIIRPDFNIPVKPSRRDIMNMSMGNMPPMWDHPQYLEQQELVVYTDVSGSMNHWYSVALYLTQQLAEFGCELYQFSTQIVKPVPGRDDNIFWTTGGTDFDTVAEHIRQKGFKAVIVITDNQDALNERNIEFLRELPELYAIFLQDGKRPVRESDNYGGCWGRAGWQKATDKITAIYSSDIEK